MGYLDGSTITVDAILTGEGRRKLAEGAGLGITKFTLEAITYAHIGMIFHLMTMDRIRVFLPNLEIEPSALTITKQGPEGAKLLNVITLNHPAEQYSFKIFDISAITVSAMTTPVNNQTSHFNVMQEMADTAIAGPATQLKVMALPLTTNISTAIEIYGLSSGAVNYATVTCTPNIREYPRDPGAQGVVS